MNNLNHLAVIMDGNGRWAKQRGHHRIFGHVKGAFRAKELVEICSQKKIPFLTLFAFSQENSQRPAKEILALFRLFEKALLRHSSLLKKHQIKLHILGDISFFTDKVIQSLETLKEQTKNHKGLNLILALNYGGQQEILSGVKKLISDVVSDAVKGHTKAPDIDKAFFERYLLSSRLPPPDLIIRTGGQTRLSNFYLWSAVYSELYFTPVLWPNFTKEILEEALKKFFQTERRFGKLHKKFEEN